MTINCKTNLTNHLRESRISSLNSIESIQFKDQTYECILNVIPDIRPNIRELMCSEINEQLVERLSAQEFKNLIVLDINSRISRDILDIYTGDEILSILCKHLPQLRRLTQSIEILDLSPLSVAKNMEELDLYGENDILRGPVLYII